MYVESLLALSQDGLARSAAHITGGGFVENIPRALPPDLGAAIDVQAWEPQPIFGMVADAAGLELTDLLSVLNMGIGMVVVVPRSRADEAVVRTKGLVDASVIGEVVAEPGVTFGSRRN